MRTIERSSRFKKDYRKHASSTKGLDALLRPLIVKLADDKPLPAKNRDHGLTGNWSGYRDCHVKPDLLLIYSKPDGDTLRLVRLGPHSELF